MAPPARNSIKGRKAYTTYRNHTSKQCQFKTDVSQDGVLSPPLFNIYTSDLPPPSAPVQVMAWLQTTQPTSGGAVTADSSYCANCVEPPRPQQWMPDLHKQQYMHRNNRTHNMGTTTTSQTDQGLPQDY